MANNTTLQMHPAPIRVTARGRTIEIHPFTQRKLADLHRVIIESRPDPMATLLQCVKDMPEEIGKHLATQAFIAAQKRSVVTYRDIGDFLETPDGCMKALALCCPAANEDWWDAFASDLTQQDLVSLTDAIASALGGDDPNLPGRVSSEQREPTK